MFPYDPAILAAVQNPPQSISNVLGILGTIENTCQDADGLKWFNGLYLTVTQAVENHVNGGGFNDPAWLSQLDVQFATLYFDAVQAALTTGNAPGAWQVMFDARPDLKITRIQFALAGMNAHINHDLCQAIVATCHATNTIPQHGTPQYDDYTSLDTTLDSLIDQAKQTLKVPLAGGQLPAVSNLEDIIAGWDISAAREQAWKNAEHLWNLPPLLAAGLMDTIDGFTTVISKGLLVPLP